MRPSLVIPQFHGAATPPTPKWNTHTELAMRLDTRDFLEWKYETEDPWGYKTNPDDLCRKERILYYADMLGPFDAVLDIGAGEGWITTDLPAKNIYGYEISDNAAARFPGNVERYLETDGLLKCDLVIATGVLYRYYDWENLIELMGLSATRIIITCHISKAEITLDHFAIFQRYFEVFPYRGKTETLRVYNVAAA